MIKMRNTIIFALVALLMLGVMVKMALAWHDGCTPGFWKNHLGEWPNEPYTDLQLAPASWLVNYFMVPAELQGDSLIMALKYPGGKGPLGAARILLRTAVAAMLNILHLDVQYRGWDFGIKDFEDLQTMVNNALGSGDRECMLVLAEELDGYNNWNCPVGDRKLSQIKHPYKLLSAVSITIKGGGNELPSHIFLVSSCLCAAGCSCFYLDVRS